MVHHNYNRKLWRTNNSSHTIQQQLASSPTLDSISVTMNYDDCFSLYHNKDKTAVDNEHKYNISTVMALLITVSLHCC